MRDEVKNIEVEEISRTFTSDVYVQQERVSSKRLGKHLGFLTSEDNIELKGQQSSVLSQSMQDGNHR